MKEKGKAKKWATGKEKGKWKKLKKVRNGK